MMLNVVAIRHPREKQSLDKRHVCAGQYYIDGSKYSIAFERAKNGWQQVNIKHLCAEVTTYVVMRTIDFETCMAN